MENDIKNENKKKVKISKFQIISILMFFLVMLSVVAKDFYSSTIAINTYPYMSLGFFEMDFVTEMGSKFYYTYFIISSLFSAIIVEILSRYVFATVKRVSLVEDIDKYRFISILKSIIVGLNLLVGVFNFMYFALPMSFAFRPVIEAVFYTIGFLVAFILIRKKYLNDKSAPIVFISFALPLAVYLIFLVIYF